MIDYRHDSNNIKKKMGMAIKCLDVDPKSGDLMAAREITCDLSAPVFHLQQTPHEPFIVYTIWIRPSFVHFHDSIYTILQYALCIVLSLLLQLLRAIFVR